MRVKFRDCHGFAAKMEWICYWLRGLFVAAALLPLLGGCRAFYENAGSHTRVGSITAPVEVSDASDSVVVRALYSMDGIDMYTAKDCKVKMTYTNVYTNSYFGMVETKGVQSSEVEIEPTTNEADTPTP